MIFISCDFRTQNYKIRSNAWDNHQKSLKSSLKDLYDFLNDMKKFFLCQKSYWNTTRKFFLFFFYAKTKIQLAFRTYLVLQFKNLIGTILPGGVWGGGSPPNVSTPFLPGCEKKGKWSEKVSSNLLKIRKRFGIG